MAQQTRFHTDSTLSHGWRHIPLIIQNAQAVVGALGPHELNAHQPHHVVHHNVSLFSGRSLKKPVAPGALLL
eukprot:scaffold17554_cov148-Isochrysis_galbana.AAC.2